MGLQGHDDVQAMWGHTLDYTNGYGGHLGAIYYYVIAGAQLSNPGVGQVTVTLRNAAIDDGHSSTYTLLLPSGDHGALTITGVNLPQVQLTAADGRPVALNVAARSLIPS